MMISGDPAGIHYVFQWVRVEILNIIMWKNITGYVSARKKIYLLSFERTMEEIFRGEGDQISKDMIDLGIRSENVSYKTNETGNVICFVQQGELWSYNQIETI